MCMIMIDTINAIHVSNPTDINQNSSERSSGVQGCGV